MTTTRLRLLLQFIGMPLLLAAAARADDALVNEVISSELQVIAYNPRNHSEAELSKAAVINSDLRLRHLLLQQSADTELKTCFGLHVLRRQIEEARQGNEADKLRLPLLLKRQAELVKVYRALHEPKSDRGGEDEPKEVEKKRGDVADNRAEAKRLWDNGRITPEQPFPARVIGVISSWVGYTLLLEETTDENPRYCVGVLHHTTHEYKIVMHKDAFRRFDLTKGKAATYLITPGVDVEHFSWSIGVQTIGRRFGEKDLVSQQYPRWLKAAAQRAD